MMNKQILFFIALFTVMVPSYQIAMEQPDNAANNQKQEQEEHECTICSMDYGVDQFIKLACKHEFCQGCLNRSFGIALKEQQTKELRCFDLACKKPIDYNDIVKIANFRPDAKEAMDAIGDIQTKEYLESLNEHKQCPTLNCKGKFLNPDNHRQLINCQLCTKGYCSNCLVMHEMRVTCQEAKQLRDKPANQAGKQEQENKAAEDWIKNNTGPCPKCKAPVEKIEGCDKMTCNKCRQTFCWRCLEPTNNYIHKNGSNLLLATCTITNPALLQNNNNAPAPLDNLFAPLFGNPAPHNNLDHQDREWAHDPIPNRNLYDIQRDLARIGRQNNRYNEDPDNQYNLGNGGGYAPIGGANNPDGNNPPRRPRFGGNGGGNNGRNFNPLYLTLLVPPALVAVRLIQWVKYPAAIKTAIETLTSLIATAKSTESSNVFGQLNRDQYLLTLSNDKIAQLREYALNDQYKEFIQFAVSCRKELRTMVAENAGFVNGFKKIRWGLSADILNIKHKIFKK